MVPGKTRSNPQDLVEGNYCWIPRTIFSASKRLRRGLAEPNILVGIPFRDSDTIV